MISRKLVQDIKGLFAIMLFLGFPRYDDRRILVVLVLYRKFSPITQQRS